MGEAEADACADLLTPRAPHHENALYFEFTLSPGERMKLWHENTDEAPADVRFVKVGRPHRGLSAQSGGPRVVADGDYAEYDLRDRERARVPRPVGSTLEAIINDRANGPHQIVFCRHSLTAFLQCIDVRQTFRFLNVLTEQFADVGALAHYHMDPDAHDPQDVSVIKQLFDTIVEVGPDEGIDVVGRPR